MTWIRNRVVKIRGEPHHQGFIAGLAVALLVLMGLPQCAPIDGARSQGAPVSQANIQTNPASAATNQSSNVLPPGTQADTRFIGNWQAAGASLDPPGENLMIDSVGGLGQAAFSTGQVLGELKINPSYQYTATFTAGDYGTVRVTDTYYLSFTSALTHQTIRAPFSLGKISEPDPVTGGQPGDWRLTLAWPTGQTMMFARPKGTVGLAGQWYHAPERSPSVLAVLAITSQGEYKFDVQEGEHGDWQAVDGKWVRIIPVGMTPMVEAYVFNGDDKVTCSWRDHSIIWTRVKP